MIPAISGEFVLVNIIADGGVPTRRTQPGSVGSVTDSTTPATPTVPASPEQPDLAAIEKDLAAVEIALTALDDGSYWVDEATGEPIPDEVLAANPVAGRA